MTNCTEHIHVRQYDIYNTISILSSVLDVYIDNDSRDRLSHMMFAQKHNSSGNRPGSTLVELE